jgi:hypothetical protein
MTRRLNVRFQDWNDGETAVYETVSGKLLGSFVVEEGNKVFSIFPIGKFTPLATTANTAEQAVDLLLAQ